LEELTPEQISLTPTIVCAYILLEQFGSKLKPGDSVLMNAAHLSASGSALLQLCKLLKLKPLCLLPLPGAPKNAVKGEYGSKSAWQDADSRAVAPPNVRAQYERISEWLVSMGAEEVFPDSVALLRWRDRNQRMLPRLALDGIATRDSTEQLIHCLQSGDKDGQVVVYGHGVTQPIEISPPLLSAWGGRIHGFNVARWVHSLSANAKKMMTLMENITKLVRANKFTLDTVLYKVGEDAISDAFTKAADAADCAQVVLVFPSLQEEMQLSAGSASAPKQSPAQKEDEEREKLKAEWLSALFTDQSVAASTPEGPLPITMEVGNKASPSSLIVWIGDQSKTENALLKDMGSSIGSSALISVAWSQHPAGEGLNELSVTAPEVCDGSWYMRDGSNFENADLDTLHDVELLGRSLVEAIEAKLASYGLDWKNVILLGFGKGAGIALYASLLKIFPKQVSAMVLFSPIVPFPGFLGQKIGALKRNPTTMKMFTIWGNRSRSTPGNYRQLLTQALRKAPEVQCTPDTLPDGDHLFDGKCYSVLQSLLPLCLPR
jgi:predicted esterase